MSKGPMKGSHGSYMKGGTTANGGSGGNPRTYYNGGGQGHNSNAGSSTSKHAPLPCRYWRQGTCKLGDACRFLHDGARPSSSSASSLTGSSSGTSIGQNAGERSTQGSSASSSLNSSNSSSSHPHHGHSHHGHSHPHQLKASGALKGSTGVGSNSGDYLSSSAGGPSVTSSSGSVGGSSQSSHGNGSDFIGEGLTTTPTQDRTGRRPFLKVVVLYASDSRVLRYAKEVQTQFVYAGVDVYLQIDLDNASISGGSGGGSASGGSSMGGNVGSGSGTSGGSLMMGGGGGQKDNEIKTENLAEIITSSTNADFLIVIGDRNMKNQSCQVKKRGKLVEMDVNEMIRAIWNEWAPFQAQFADLDPKLSAAHLIEQLSTTQLYIVLQRFPPQVNFEDSLKRSREALEEIKSFFNKKTTNSASTSSGPGTTPGKPKKPAALPSLMTSSILTGSNTVILDEKQAAKFQKAQNILMRLHKQCLALSTHISELPESRTEENFVIDQEQFGRPVGPDYRPQQALTSQISALLRHRLITLLSETQTTLESYGSELSTWGAPLWTGYITQLHGGDVGDLALQASFNDASQASHHISSASSGLSYTAPVAGRSSESTSSSSTASDGSYMNDASRPQPSANEWSCKFCTSFNELHLKECYMCGNARSGDANADEGSWETAGEKKRKKAAAAASTVSATTTASDTSVVKPTSSISSIPSTGLTTAGAHAKTSSFAAAMGGTSPSTTGNASSISGASSSANALSTSHNTPNAGSAATASSTSSGAAPTSTGSTTTKKKLLDPIPGLAAKQAAKSSGTGSTKLTSSSSTVTSNSSTTTSNISSTAGSTASAPIAIASPSTYSSIVISGSPNGTPGPITSISSSIPTMGSHTGATGATAPSMPNVNGSPASGTLESMAFPPLSGPAPSVSSQPPASSITMPGISTSLNPANAPMSISNTLSDIFGSAANGALNYVPASTFPTGSSMPSSSSAFVPTGGNGSANGANSYFFDESMQPPYFQLDASKMGLSGSAASWQVPEYHLGGTVTTAEGMILGPTPWKVGGGYQDIRPGGNGGLSSSSANSSSKAGHNAWGKPPNGVVVSTPAGPSGLRTPTKAQQNGGVGGVMAPHSPSFTTPFKGSNGGRNSLSTSYGPTSSSVMEEFQQAEPKIGVAHPCWFCGEESNVECNLCPKVGLETFFCSGQHQTLVWKHHVRTCHPVSPSLAASFETNSYHSGVAHSAGASVYEPRPRREPPVQPPLPRYSSPNGRTNYS